MGCDTHGVIKGRISGETLLAIIRKEFDPNATTYGSEYKNYKCCSNELRNSMITFDSTESPEEEIGSIYFTYKDEDRKLFYINQNYRFKDDTNENGEVIPENHNFYESFEHTWLNLGFWGNSVEIMRKIISYFGGWVDDNDCDNDDFYDVPKMDRAEVSVIHMTYDELCEKLGGVVVITDRKLAEK